MQVFDTETHYDLYNPERGQAIGAILGDGDCLFSTLYHSIHEVARPAISLGLTPAQFLRNRVADLFAGFGEDEARREEFTEQIKVRFEQFLLESDNSEEPLYEEARRIVHNDREGQETFLETVAERYIQNIRAGGGEVDLTWGGDLEIGTLAVLLDLRVIIVEHQSHRVIMPVVEPRLE